MTFGSGYWLYYPGDIQIDGSGNIWVADPYRGGLQEFSNTGTHLASVAGPASYFGIDSSGNFWSSCGYTFCEYSSTGSFDPERRQPHGRPVRQWLWQLQRLYGRRGRRGRRSALPNRRSIRPDVGQAVSPATVARRNRLPHSVAGRVFATAVEFGCDSIEACAPT